MVWSPNGKGGRGLYHDSGRSGQQLLNGKGNHSQLCASASETYITHAYLFW